MLLCAGMASQTVGYESSLPVADLSMTFVFDSDVLPDRKPLLLPGDPSCMPENLQPLSERLLVNPKDKGIQNVVLYLDTKLSPLKDVLEVASDPPATSPVKVEIRNCVYIPHVFLARVGQPIALSNHDRFGHNPSLIFFANDPESRLQPPENVVTIEPKVSERAPTPIHCNLHPWMKAYVIVTDHPYVAISNEHGRIFLKNLPARKKWTFRLWHESFAAPIPHLIIHDQIVALKQNRLEIELEPGSFDWGEIRLDPTSFLK